MFADRRRAVIRHERAPMNTLFRMMIGSVVLASVVGCVGSRSSRATTSVVDFLYPASNPPEITAQKPVLNLPLRVGVAFVPASTRSYAADSALTESMKQELLKSVADHFKSKPFVAGIEVIPSAYLQAAGSFENLDQVRTMYGIDVIALVSFDQAQFTDQGFMSLTYWTIVGAYVVPAEKNATHTMLDTVVYDIPSRKLLFRAPGTSQVKGRATAINVTKHLREDSVEGFDQAAVEMIANLDRELDLFKDRVRDNPGEIAVINASGPDLGSTGGGAAGPAWLLLLAGLAGSSLWLRRRA